MIPEKIVKFLEEDATIAVGGTRSKALIPNLHRVSGWRVGLDRQTISCSIPEAFCDGLLRSLNDNRQFALTVEQTGSHETYQFKGEYIDSRSPNEADLAAFEQARERFGKDMNQFFGIDDDASRAYTIKPGVVINFAVKEIFLQTPGPGAGRRLVPPEEE